MSGDGGVDAAYPVAGVIGWPVGHSKSPVLHGHWLARYGLAGAYVPMAVPPAGLKRALAALPLFGFRGCNITVPHKEAAIAAMDTVDGFARRIGAINTVVIDDEGRLHGSNTDGFGFLENLRAAGGWRAEAGPAVVLGAGGAARSIVAALLDAGVPELRLVNRTTARAEALAGEIAGADGRRARVVDWTERGEALAGAALLVNTTTLGMAGQPPLDLPLDALPDTARVTDIVYAPLVTPLLAAARARGLVTVDGLGMLLHQARPGFEAWFGVRPTVDAALRAAVLDDAEAA
ncbi:MAG: shikimate dehydrogenase [Azospirillaceae bacterium]